MDISKALLDPAAYPEKVKKIILIQTHSAWVFLTGKHAYKIKKPVNLGFLDFSTLEKRKFYCNQELKLNRRLAWDLYLGVLPITKEKDGKIKINGKGKIIDFAVVMKEIPQERLMSTLLQKNKVKTKTVKEIAKIIAKFHQKKYPRVKKEYKSEKIIKRNWNENFEQTKPFVEKTILKKDFDLIKKAIKNFFKKNNTLLQKRVRENKIKWCHGDLHSGNIFITEKNKIYIFDCIEFNERFACQDVANEVAFLAMDLDFWSKKDLADCFIKSYLKYTKDQELLNLLNFYKCYRAFVRGKVISLKTCDKNIEKNEQKKAAREAKKYFKLSLAYAKQF